jgi:hypothetical protein
MNNIRYIVFAIAAVLVAGVFFSTLELSKAPPSLPLAPETAEPVTNAAASSTPALAQVQATPCTEVCTIPAQGGETVLASMRAYAEAGGITFTGTEYPGLGFFVESINGRENARNYSWFLYLNGISSQTGASATVVREGDIVEWRYKDSY